MVYNATIIFVETKLFTSRILDAMSDDEYAALQDHLSRHPDVGALIPGAGGVRRTDFGSRVFLSPSPGVWGRVHTISFGQVAALACIGQARLSHSRKNGLENLCSPLRR